MLIVANLLTTKLKLIATTCPIHAALLNFFLFFSSKLINCFIAEDKKKRARKKYIYIRRNENEVNATAGSVYVRPSNTLERRFFVFFLLSTLCISPAFVTRCRRLICFVFLFAFNHNLSLYFHRYNSIVRTKVN